MTGSTPHPCISSISAVLPAYNDYATIASMVLTARIALAQISNDYEIIVINDGSNDSTAQVLIELSHYLSCLHVIYHSGNQGYGVALRSGFSAATKEWIFYTDGDGQYNPLELIQLTQALREGVDIVNGYKVARHDPLHRIIIGWIYNVTIKWLFGLTLRDIDCDFRLIRRKVFDQITLESESGTICVEMVKKFQDAGFVFVEIPVQHYYRVVGVSQFFNRRHLWRTAKQLIKLWWKLVVRNERKKHSNS